MDPQLLTLSKIFTERLFRIPDYQRGYAWTEKQLKEFWGDVEQLEPNNNHYTGVLTLEDVGPEIYERWEDDLWIIEAKSYKPYFVVDGQQRLTTAIILVQVILEQLDDDEKLNFTDKFEIQRRFIFDSKDDGISRSYIFGYERDNPSYEYLKVKIFCERSSKGGLEQTVYTQNLERAKKYFQEAVSGMSRDNLEALYRKVTQHLLFNIFTITDDVDVCVAFETMNNRGKPLSYLELLKNRLIYLSLRFDAPVYERKKLRRSINDCWKSLYHNLGRNADQPLEDDKFLSTHYVLYFGKALFLDISSRESSRYRRLNRADYASDLLEQRFVPRNVTPDAPADAKISLPDIYRYVSSLQEAVELWYRIWNPLDSDLPKDSRIYLDKLNRLGVGPFLPLVLAALQTDSASRALSQFLRVLERHLFVQMLTSREFRYYVGPESVITSPQSMKWAIDLAGKRVGIDRATKHLREVTDNWVRNRDFLRILIAAFRKNGYYSWEGVRYLLFEYNLELQSLSKTARPKIFWPEFTEHSSDFVTVEHIYPRQARHAYWSTRFGGFSKKQRGALRHSLGNLLPLSRPKNSSLANRPFPDKVEGQKNQYIGYRYGSYAENEVAKESEWCPEKILLRGLRMLEFVEERWDLQLGTGAEKRRLLGLEFIEGREKLVPTKRNSGSRKDS